MPGRPAGLARRKVLGELVGQAAGEHGTDERGADGGAELPEGGHQVIGTLPGNCVRTAQRLTGQADLTGF